MTPNAIIALLYSEGMAWFGAVAYGVGYLAYNLTNLCATDPPALPVVDAARLWGYTNPLNPEGAAQLRQDAQAIVAYWLWYQYCECVTGPQPVKPGPPAQPTGQATDQTANPQTPGSCQDFKLWFESLSFDINNNAVASGEAVVAPTVSAQWYELQLNVFQNQTSTAPIPNNLTFTLQELPLSATGAAHYTWDWPANTPTSTLQYHRFPWHSGVGDFQFTIHADTRPTVNVAISADLRIYCNALHPNLEQSCCPPDPNLLALINEVLQLEQEILSKTAGSIAYTKGTAHTALSGSGSLSITGLRGVLIDITAGSPTKPPLVGNPAYLWDMGWISIMDGDGMIEEKRLTRQHQVWTPRLAANGTVVGYYLNPGVQVNITELLPA